MGAKNPVNKKNKKIQEKTAAKNALKADTSYILGALLILGIGGGAYIVWKDSQK